MPSNLSNMFSKLPPPKPVFSKKQRKAISEIAQLEINEEVEKKYQVQQVANTVLLVAPTASGDVSAVGNYFPILTAINQGDANHNQRVGNEIILKSLSVDCTAYFANLYADDARQYYDGNLGVRFLILRQRDQNTANGAIGAWKGNDLLKSSGGPTAWTGKSTDLHCPINLEAYAVIHDSKTVMMNNKATTQSTNFDLAFTKPGDFKKLSYNFKFGKHGKKLKFVDDAATFSTNFPYIGVILYCGLYGDTAPNDQLLRFNKVTYAQYTDA